MMSDFSKKPQDQQGAIDAHRRTVKHPAGTPQIFVVRFAGAQLFGWEIRKFGSFVLSRSETGFTTQPLAQTAGEKALAALTPA